MATFRVGVGSFNIKDSAVGIGTETTGHGNLKVEGTLKSTNLDVLGVSTFTRYSGFNADEVKVSNRDLTLSGEYSTTGDIVVDDDASLTVGLGSTACVGAVECISVKHHFSVPVGDTAQRDGTSGYGEGTVRYNTDLGTMEFFNGNEWRQFTYIVDASLDPKSNTSTMGRAVIMGGASGASPFKGNEIQFFQIMTLGNSEDFGDLIESHQYAAGSGSKTRGIIAGGYSAPDSNNSQPRIEYITIASKGDGITFGELSSSHFRNSGGASSSTRGLFFGGGHPSYFNTIEYVEINTLGDALDFGDLNSQKMIIRCTASPTRAFARGGFHPSNDSKVSSQIDMVTIASKGNAIKFGDPTQRTYGMAACANNIRAIYAGGYSNHPDSSVIATSTTIEYFTMASEGDAIDFGDLMIAKASPCGNSNQVRGVISGGYVAPTGTNSMEFITITTTGAAQDFGDLIDTDFRMAGTSDSHGGLGGY